MAQKEEGYPSLDTPAVLIDLDTLEANIKETTEAAKEAGIKIRPHVKVHQCPDIAKMQIKAGGVGVEVGLIDQAFVMAKAGIDDILIAHPFYGERKFEKIKLLLTRYPRIKLSILVDMIEQAEGLSQVGHALKKKIPVLVKVDAGIRRYGVMPGAPLLKIAKQIRELPGVEFAGIYTHESGAPPTPEGVALMALQHGAVMSEMARMLRREGFTFEHVTTGSSPTHHDICRYIKEGVLRDITEVHPGQRFIGDLTYMWGRGNTREQIALTILTTVVSTSHYEYVVIDAGFKTLGRDPMFSRRNQIPDYLWKDMPSFGTIQGRNDLWLGRLGAESGWLNYKDPGTKDRLKLGDRLEIVPNSASLVLNIHSVVYGIRNGAIEREFKITGCGLGT